MEKWREGGVEALRSKGPMCVELLGPAQWERFVGELGHGSLAHGWDVERLDAGADPRADHPVVPGLDVHPVDGLTLFFVENEE